MNDEEYTDEIENIIDNLEGIEREADRSELPTYEVAMAIQYLREAIGEE